MKEGMRLRVREGIILLDREGPPGWRGMIDGDTLKMVSCTYCVLGQVYGSSVVAANILFAGDSPRMSDYGFNLHDEDIAVWRGLFETDPDFQPHWNPFDRLRDVWLEELAAVS